MIIQIEETVPTITVSISAESRNLNRSVQFGIGKEDFAGQRYYGYVTGNERVDDWVVVQKQVGVERNERMKEPKTLYAYSRCRVIATQSYVTGINEVVLSIPAEIV